MPPSQEQIDQLMRRLDHLLARQNAFAREIAELRREIHRLQAGEPEPVEHPAAEEPAVVETLAEAESIVPNAEPGPSKWWFQREGLERFVGENLISTIGIAILVIGVAIGAKYAIDTALLGPLGRIILGYLAGAALLVVALRLRETYPAFSAVLFSGAMTIGYFITYFAYDFYGLLGRLPAFAIMLALTVVTVVAALRYDRQIIAHMGLVGAYAVPFLLSNDAGRVAGLFSYMALINGGVLFLAFKKYWKELFYSAFGFTWLIYGSWFVLRYWETEPFWTAAFFLLFFFVLFYTTFLAYKLIRWEAFGRETIILLLLNSFIFYALGYVLLAEYPNTERLLGLYTLGNAALHALATFIIYRQPSADRRLLHFTAGLALVFVTMTIPVQLDGNWVTLLWAGEAALLFWIGRKWQTPPYERLAYVLMALALISLAQDWQGYYVFYSEPVERLQPFFNPYFLTALCCIGAFGFIAWVNSHYPFQLSPTSLWSLAARYGVPVVLIALAYFTFKVEIDLYWGRRYVDSMVTPPGDSYGVIYNDDLPRFQFLWVLNYSLLFFALLGLANTERYHSRAVTVANLFIDLFLIFIFLVGGLYTLSELRESYLLQPQAKYYSYGAFHLGIRYVSLLCFALLFGSVYRYVKADGVTDWLAPAPGETQHHPLVRVIFDLLLALALVWIASSELLHWLDLADTRNAYKLTLSLLWGSLALLLVGWGIWQRRKHLRIGAIVLFGVTLVKLFLYDLSNLSTLAKTIVLVSLGVLLLVISFLYTKYRKEIDS